MFLRDNITYVKNVSKIVLKTLNRLNAFFGITQSIWMEILYFNVFE